MRTLFATLASLLLAAALLAEDHPAPMVGRYTFAAPGSCDTLVLTASGAYTLITATEGPSPTTTRISVNEEGIWRFDGWAVVLEPKKGKSDSPQMQRFRRLFPLEDGASGKLLVSAVLGSAWEGCHFLPLFTKDEANKTPLPTPVARPPSNHDQVPGAADL